MKVLIYETRMRIGTDRRSGEPLSTPTDELKHSLESDDPKVIAAFLRGVADSYDPSKKHVMRGQDATRDSL